jgi:glutaredoxin
LLGRAVKLPKTDSFPIESFPILVTATWCPYTLPAKNFWNKAAESVGLDLKVVDAESEEGSQVISSVKVAGVPCLVIEPDHLIYGIQWSASEAESFLQSYIA